MSSEVYQPPVQATTDESGNCVWTLPGPTGGNLAVQATVSVSGAGNAGSFYALISSGIRWGDWSGSQPFGPITWPGNMVLQVFGSGLLPNTEYTLSAIGVVDELDNLDNGSPTATGNTQVSGELEIVDELGVQIDQQTEICYRYFPCDPYASLHLAAKLSDIQVESGLHSLAVKIRCTWYNNELTQIVGRREFVIGAFLDEFDTFTPSFVEVTTPHLGPMLEICVFNNTEDT